MPLRIVFLLSLLISLQVESQLDTRKLDSLSRSIDSSAKATRTSIDSISRTLDSMMRTDARKNIIQPSPVKKEVETSHAKWIVLTVVGVTLLGSILVYLYNRDRKIS